MKLTICQIVKLFLLLTAAFSFHNSPTKYGRGLSKGLLVLAIPVDDEDAAVVFQPTSELATSSAAVTTTTTTATTLKLELRTTSATVISSAAWTSTTAAKPLTSTTRTTPTPSNAPAREGERQKRQKQKSATRQKYQHQQQGQQEPLPLPLPSKSAQDTSTFHRVGVLIPPALLNDKMHVQQGFQHFVDYFHVHLDNVTVEFLPDVDLSGFIKLLQLPKYTTVVKTLNAGINVDTGLNDAADEHGSVAADAGGIARNGWNGRDTDPNQRVTLRPKANAKEPRQQKLKEKQNQNQNQQATDKLKQLSADALSTSSHPQQQQQQQHEEEEQQQEEEQQSKLLDARSVGHCQLAEQLAHDYNKRVILWPCPRMKISSNFLPSFEAISFAVQSIASKLNWTQVDIYVGDDNWGLPLAIAANLHIPYRIAIGDTIRDLHGQDKPGQAIIITAPLNDGSTLRLLNNTKWVAQQPPGQQQQQHIKVLLIDIVASSLNAEHRFYKYLARINAADATAANGFVNGGGAGGAGLATSNLLVLTMLSDKYRHFLNEPHGGMAAVQNFRQRQRTMPTTTNNNNKNATWTFHCNATPSNAIEKLRPFIDYFSLYDFLIAHTSYMASFHGNASKVAAVAKYDFIVLDIVRSMALNGSYGPFKWRPLLILEQHELNGRTYITHSIQPGYDDWLLVSSVQLWHCGAICWTIVAICVGLLLIIVAASVAAGIAMRNYLLRQRLSKGPNKIVLSASDFVFPVDSRRVDEGIEAMLCCWLQQLQEFGGPEVDKPDLLKGSIGSLKNLGFVIPGAPAVTSNAATSSTTTTAVATTTVKVAGKSASAAGSLARHKPAHLDMRARYNGDLVQLKEIPMNGSTELRSKAMDLLVIAHGLRHENINPLIGWLSDPNRTAMVFDYCSRGSLQDVLIMDEIKLDWSFRLSLLTDLVRGMRYLHASPLRVHGTLTSRNCVVDARWVLKITDYGLTSFYESQCLPPVPRSAKELLWTAPELLRTMKSQQQHHHHHSRVMLGTQLGDVYSFGIIMQEVVVRGEPYCMLSLSPEEIIAKIKKPPPLIRPSVSKGAAPPEAINIMRQCWAEQPEMRPDFNSVYERFKMLNHGRKVNFVDTMFQMLEKYSNNLEELIRERTEQLDIERKKTEQLLNRMLPSSVAEKLKMGLAVDPEEFSDVTIYFSDIVGFTTIAAHCSPVQVVDLLNDLYTIFDATINAYNVYKVETIGDAYMVVSGVPVKIPDHAEQIATMALDLLHQSGRFNVKHLPGVPLQLRIGLHTGPCCAGVVGLTMPRYCLFGDTVNTASRMESTGSSWRIHMSQETRDRLEARGGYAIEPRGLIDIKGKGMMNTFWLLGKKGFDKQLPAPPPIGESHGLDESLIRNSITLKAQANKSRTSTNPSSSQSSSLAGESVEVKVEITPPTNVDVCSSNFPNSYSLDSNSTNTISPNPTLCPEFPTKTPSTSPQSRKLSELTPDNLLNPNSFNRLPNSTGGSSSRLYKKIEEIMDLSSPYNHYKCLSPSESNLTQFYDGKYLYSSAGGAGSGANGPGSGGCSHSGSTAKFDSKPGSSRLLRRQFSLDRDDQQSKLEQHHQTSLQANYQALVHNATKSSTLDIPMIHETVRSPKTTLTRAHKQNSTSITQDLEKIEEIPLSPASSQHHSSLDSNLNRSPPSTLEAQSPPVPPPLAMSTRLSATSPPMLSAPTSPAPSRTLNGLHAFRATMSLTSEASPLPRNANPNANAPPPLPVTVNSNANANANNNEEPEQMHRAPELTLNVETLLSR
ncbi:uncharacterized protein LOC115623929 [Scaptodrosophila lebanonensis]|uniref:Guanylate cyclase n=1 Tax=Drosophila lebanonensis TaxID=7225 RepID=A0A6J2TGY8_DROLE|nr:uncharacterized protein LOC115623929 [Scaptodrosophila lebanonensis]